MTQTTVPQRGSLGQRLSGFDPLRTFWALLCNVKFALFLVGSAVVAGLIGTIIPQLPGPMRGNPAARQAWLEAQRADYGSLTDPMYRLGLFDVFNSWWFTLLWVFILMGVAVSTASRLRPIARSVHRPQRQVNDRYFDVAHHRASFTHAGGVEAVEELLRRKRYTVERVEERADGTTYLFGKRFLLSQYGTVVSHLALILLMVGGLMTRFVGFSNTLALAEETPAAPVFTEAGPGQIFIRMEDAVRRTDEAGNVIDFRSFLEIRRGDEVVTCVTTVNDPCGAFGYKFHQAAFFDDIGKLQVTGPEGLVLFSSYIDFDDQRTAVPFLRVANDDGTILFEQALPQTATETGRPGAADDVALGLLSFAEPGSEGTGFAAPVAWRILDNRLEVALSMGGTLVPLPQGVPQAFGDYEITYIGATSIPAITIADMPGAIGDRVVVQMLVDAADRAYFVVAGIAEEPVFLEEGVPVITPAGYQYVFGGQLEAAGIEVKRDPGDLFIWLGVILALSGLATTFYVPRRRLWVKVTPERTYVAGIAERTTRLGRELRLMGAELGAKDALREEDLSRADDW